MAASDIRTSHLTCTANRVFTFYMKCNTELLVLFSVENAYLLINSYRFPK